jgi:hypothetical protein
MAGVKAEVGTRRVVVIGGHSSAAVTANLQLGALAFPFPQGRIIGVVANAATAGTGAGNTVLDILKNGTTMYTTAANKPTLAATSTGEFANTLPDVQTVVAGDMIRLICASVSTTGHAAVAFSVVIEVI